MKTRNFDLLSPLLFLFFFTLHADQLGFAIGSFHIRLNNLLLVVVLTLSFMKWRKELFILEKRMALSLALLTCAITLSAFLSHDLRRCAAFLLWYSVTVIGYFLLPLFLILKKREASVLNLYCYSFVAVGLYAGAQLLFSCFGVYDPFCLQSVFSLARPNAFAYEPSYYALYMSPFIMMVNFSYLFGGESRVPFLKNLNGVKVLFINVLFLLSTSTTAFLSYLLFIVITACASLFFPSLRRKVAAFFAAFLVFSGIITALFPSFSIDYFLKFFVYGFAHHSFYERWLGIQNAWIVFLEHPLLGVGLGGVPSYLYEAWARGDGRFTFYMLGNPQSITNFLKYFEPSNVFTELLASVGLVGTSCFLLVVYALWKRFKEALMILDPMWALNLLISSVALIFLLQINQGVLRTYVWTHLALVFGIYHKACLSAPSLSLQNG